METLDTPCPPTPASATGPHSISTAAATSSQTLTHASLSSDVPAQRSGPHMNTSVGLSDPLTGSPLTSDPTLAPQSAPFQSTLNLDPLLSVPSPPLPPQHNSYTLSSNYVSYMKSLLNSHFPQEDGPGPLH